MHVNGRINNNRQMRDCQNEGMNMKIISCKKTDTHKIINILGLKIKIKRSKISRLNNEFQKFKEETQYKMCKYLPKEKYADYLKDWYYENMGETLDLENPKTFNEKIQWLKLYDSTPIKTKLADKYLVRDWVKEKIGEEYLIPLLGVWDKFDDIDFDKLPDKFVLKCNHGCGYNIIVKDKSKLDIEEVRKKINQWMTENFAFKNGLELHYSSIPRKIIAEKYLETKNGDLQDYKFICMDGDIKVIWVDKDRYNGHKRNLYDTDWNLLDKQINTHYQHFNDCEKPHNFDKMKEFAKLMSKGFALVRVDFYENNDNLYFGEMTFTIASGIGKTYPTSYDLELGDMLKLPEKKNS